MALRRILIALCALLFCLPAMASAQSFPPLTGRVVDDAHILPPEQAAALDQKLAALEQQTGRQLVVATIPDLQGHDVADYGYQLGRAWGIGQKDQNNGAILLVAPNEKRMTIQVGYGLEPILTDALSGRIIRDVIAPRFKAGDFPGGIAAGVDEISRIIQLPPDEQRRLVAEAARPQQRKIGLGDIVKAIIIVVVILFFVFVSLIRAATRGGRRYGNGGGVSPIVIWAASEILSDSLRGRGGGGGWGGGGGGGGGGFSGGGGSFGGGGASGGW